MNILVSIFKYQCPRCRKHGMFRKPFQLKNPLDMYEHCPNCEQAFEPEPGFYYGAMFLSYAIYSFILLPTAFFFGFGLGWRTLYVMMMVVLIGLLLYIKVLRISRSLWIHFIVRYEPEDVMEE